MKTQSAALANHRKQASTSLTQCWKITRRDGAVYGFTALDRDVPYDGLGAGIIYKARTGLLPSAVEARADLSVPNLDVVSYLDSESITEADLMAGRWDGAEVWMFEVNWKDLTQGHMILRRGFLGNVSLGQTMFNVELRGLAQLLQKSIGRTYTSGCTARFGDSDCTYPVESLRVTGTVTAYVNKRYFVDASRGEAQDYFRFGELTWTSGPNAGLKMEVRSFDAGGQIGLALPIGVQPDVGDAYTMIPGCAKRKDEDCRDRWNNVINFQGFPNVPGTDSTLGAAGISTT